MLPFAVPGATPASQSSFVDALPLAQLPPGSQQVWQHGLLRILLCRTASGVVHAVQDVCPHARQPMAGGAVDEVTITCPKHGARFDLRSGTALSTRITERPLKVFAVRIENDTIQVQV